MRFSSASALLALVASAAGLGQQGKVATSNTGCDLSAMVGSPGFQASVFSYPIGNTQMFSSTGFYLSGYSDNGLITTGLLADAQFSQQINGNDEVSGTIGSLEVPMSNFALELTAYFYGMCQTIRQLHQKISFKGIKNERFETSLSRLHFTCDR